MRSSPVERARLPRIEPEALERERAGGALIVDIRPSEQRARDGALPGSIVADRNVLEWRLDPHCGQYLAEVTSHHSAS